MMSTADINDIFARAEQAYLAGRLEEARASLAAILRMTGDISAVLHLLGLVEKKSGNLDSALGAFERAAVLAPRDPQLANNLANILRDLGRESEALRVYDVAIALAPDFKDARFNRALLLEHLGRLDDALAELENVRDPDRPEARIEAARGAILRKLGELDEAAAAFDAALALHPDRVTALQGRAKIAVDRGEGGGSSLYHRALSLHPGDKELMLALAEALEAEGETRQALLLLHSAVQGHASWIAGHEALARMRSEAGESHTFAEHYRTALQARPDDLALNRSYWRSLAQGERYSEALEALNAAKSTLAPSPDIVLIEASLLSAMGDAEVALALLDRAGEEIRDTFPYLLARSRIELRARRYHGARQNLERAVEIEPDSVNAWAHLDLAWRLTEDTRHDWLTGQPGLFGASEIDMGEADLQKLAETLRIIHRARAHPLGQSVRGGTQTRGRLLLRCEPDIVRLRDVLVQAITSYFQRLPAADPVHPLLRHRNASNRIGGSWSVRLTGGGFHVNHIHPNGIVSSALYIAVPTIPGNAERREGWLELGRPPRELDLSLSPIAVIEPKPGRLALFPSYLFHGTVPFETGERLTVAFDVERV